jgi:anthranilate synthase component 2
VILVIDNYDSFTYNLVQYLGELAVDFPVANDLQVVRNDKITVDEIRVLNPDAVVISPGPGRPDDAGVSLNAIAQLGDKLPILGVCLGHQSIGQVFGGKIVSAPELMHGKTSLVSHTGIGIFQGLENPLTATRYHSLVIERETCPEVLEITGTTESGVVMSLRHKSLPIEGVQFHPESVLTEHGHQMLANWLVTCGDSDAPKRAVGLSQVVGRTN